MTARYFQSIVPEPGELDARDHEMLEKTEQAFPAVGDLLAACKFKAAITEVMALAQAGNRYLDELAPWKTAKVDRTRTATTLFVGLRLVDSLKTLFCPFTPHTAQALHAMMGYEGTIIGELRFEEVDEAGEVHRAYGWHPGQWEGRWAPSTLPAGRQLGQPQPLFRKLDESIVEEELERMGTQGYKAQPEIFLQARHPY
jgi:methionyl-tRNA synthetase